MQVGVPAQNIRVQQLHDILSRSNLRSMQQQIIGLIAVGVGFHLVYKTNDYMGWLGSNAWAEQTFGPGGTRLFYKLIGITLCFLGILGITGTLSELAFGTLSLFFGPRK